MIPKLNTVILNTARNMKTRIKELYSEKALEDKSYFSYPFK